MCYVAETGGGHVKTQKIASFRIAFYCFGKRDSKGRLCGMIGRSFQRVQRESVNREYRVGGCKVL